ncbi:hypothetical protein [Flavobacterium sedimenticola]|uniref:SGNH/GDSL hydrolase family protein n=1 Tax=Flavobacterium sedimenticola TaxID=3043286 RepID=A0ABT6XP27_9FLAO|nr:hypothetical protein [Flavobacterium sedimenticola]MDI9256838.1 hypothetical protein [Flavobacterium sedimenticola]
MNLKQSLIVAVLVSLSGLAAWECYWRSQGFYPNIDDNKDLWAVQRAKVADLTDDDVILIGSSRVLFDIQLDEWAEKTGRKPLQLASPGSSPLPVFHDLVENTDFKGTILVGVTPGLFFSTTFPEAFPWKRPQTKVDYYHNRTYAQQLNHMVSLPLQRSLVMMSGSEEEWSDDIDLKALVSRITIGNRTGAPDFPPFYNFNDTRIDRNTTMTARTVNDTAFANSIKKVWEFFGKSAPPPDKKATMAFFLQDLKKYKARGGTVLLVRCPSSGMLKKGEDMVLPRVSFWDELVKQAQVKSYYFEDYKQLQFECPEWSHLSASDARKFTVELVKILKTDGVLSNPKNQ